MEFGMTPRVPIVQSNTVQAAAERNQKEPRPTFKSKPLRRQRIGIWKKYRRPATIALLLHQEVWVHLMTLLEINKSKVWVS